MRRAAIRARADRAEDEPTRGGCGVAGGESDSGRLRRRWLGPLAGSCDGARSVPSLARGICAGCGWWVRRIGSLSHLGGRRRSCDGAASALRRRAMDYALCTMDYGLWTMDYGLIASPTNAERCRGTAGAVAMGYRRQRGALARLSLAASRVFDLKMLGGGSMSERTTIGENFEERKI